MSTYEGDLTTRAKRIFLDALERSEVTRADWAAGACGEDGQLLARVHSLLESHRRAHGVFGRNRADWRLPLVDQLACDATELHAGDRVGGYELVSELGEGGFGVVYLAQQEEPVKRRVALKVVKPGMDTRAVLERFELERQALALMDHPNIARVLDAGTTESGRPYFVMELVEGEPISDYCDRQGLGVRARLALFRDVCQAVQHAHQKGIVHRDIKPSNVLVARVDGRALPKVIDFGIAKAVGDGELTAITTFTRNGHLVGTPAYMSPEQAEGALDVDTRTDVYSLGALLYELLSGGPPFDIADLGFDALVQSIREIDPPLPSARRKAKAKTGALAATSATIHIPREVDWIVMRCLEKRPMRRYSTASSLAREVDCFLEDRPIEAAPPSTWYRVRKLARRHRAAALASLAVLVTLVLGTIGTGMGLVRARQANEGLDAALAQAQRQARIAAAVNEFLTEDLLSAAVPSSAEGEGKDTRVREVLDMAATRLLADSVAGGRLAGEAAVVAAVHATIGNSYEALGIYADAQRHLELAVELRRRELGAGDLETLGSMSDLAHVLAERGDWSESEALQRRALELLRETFGAEQRQSISSMHRLAVVLEYQGRSAEALALLEEARAIAESALGEDDATTVSVLSRLATAYATMGRSEEAEALIRRAYGIRRRTLGPESIATLESADDLASFLRRHDRFEDADELYREVLEARRRIFGEDHPETLQSAIGLAWNLRETDRFDEAESLLRAHLDTVYAVFGSDHRRALTWTVSLAHLEELRGNFEQALVTYREVWERSRRALGTDHPYTLDRAVEVAGILLRRADYPAAEEILFAVYAAHRRALGPQHLSTLVAQRDLGNLYRYADRAEDSERTLTEALDNARAGLGDEHLITRGIVASLATLYAVWSRFEEAEVLLEEAAPLEELGEGTEYMRWLTAVAGMAQVLRAAGRVEEAERWERKLAENNWPPQGSALD